MRTGLTASPCPLAQVLTTSCLYGFQEKEIGSSSISQPVAGETEVALGLSTLTPQDHQASGILDSFITQRCLLLLMKAELQCVLALTEVAERLRSSSTHTYH